LRRQRRSKVRRQRAIDTAAGFVKGPHPLRFSGEPEVSVVFVDHRVNRPPRGFSEVYQLQAVECSEANVREQPIVRLGDQVPPAAEKIGDVVDLGDWADNVTQVTALGVVWFDEQDAI
jgi:hypothetical protein